MGSSEEWNINIEELWGVYQTESDLHGYPRQIETVIYANGVVYSDVFWRPAVLQVGFQTMLYHCTLMLVIGNIFSYNDRYNSDEDYDEEEDYLDDIFITNSVDLYLRVIGPHSYRLSEADVEEMEEYWTPECDEESHNPVAEYFARKHCSHLEESQISSLAQDLLYGDFGSAVAVRKLVKQLIDRYLISFTVK